MSNNSVNISLKGKNDPTVNITVNEAGTISGTGSVSPVINFVATGEQGATGAQGEQGTVSGTDVISQENISPGAIGTSEIENNSVTNDKLGTNSIYGNVIPDYAITNAKIGPDSITSNKIADNAVTSDHIAPNAINEELIESGIITRASLADNTITSAKIQNYTLVTTDFSLNSVTGEVIADNPVITGDVSAVNYKARGASPGKFEGPDNDEMHLKFHTDLKFVNSSGQIIGSIDQDGNLTISGTVDGIDISTDVAANTLKQTNVTTNISVDQTENTVTIQSSDGSDGILEIANSVDAGAYPPSDKIKVDRLTVTQSVDLDAMETKLAGIEPGATADQTTEEIQDIVGDVVATGGTKTGIAITYDDDNNNMDFVVDHDAATNFVAEEHYRWDNDIQSTATINHLNLSSDTPGETEVLVMNDGDAVWGHGEKIHIQVRNDEGSTILAGQPLYSKGEIGGSNRVLVGVCDANDSSKMPCIGVAHSEMNTTSTKDNFAVVSGIYNTNISGFTSLNVGDNLYIQNDGSLSQFKPSEYLSKVQNVGIVLRTNGSICQGLLVSAIGRTNDLPNLNSGTFFMGNSSNLPQPVNFSDQVNNTLQTQTTTFLRNIAGEADDLSIQSQGEMKFIIDMPDNETGQVFTFHNGGTSGGSTEIVNFSESGDVTIQGDFVAEGDVTIKGNTIKRNNGDEVISFSSTSGAATFASTVYTDQVISKDNADFQLWSRGNIEFRLDVPNDETGQSFSFMNHVSGISAVEIANLDESGNLQIDGDLTVSGNEIKDEDGTTCVTFDSSGNTTIANTLNASVTGNVTGNVSGSSGSCTGNAATATALTAGNKTLDGNLTIGANGAGHDLKLYGDTNSQTLVWDASEDFLKFTDGAKIVFGTGQAASDFDSSIQANGSNLVIYNDTGNIQIGDTVEITGDLDVDGTITATKIESATQFSHEGDANTGLEFSSDTVTIEANNENVAVFSSNAITFDEALSMGSNGDGKSLNLYGSTSGVKIAWSAYGNGLLINDNTRVNFGTPSGGPSGDVYFNFDGTKLQLAPTATNGDNIFEISKPGTGTTSLNLQGDLTVDGDIAAGGNLTGVTNFIDVKTAAYWSSSTSAIYVPISGATTSESTSLSTASYTTMFVVPFGGKVTRITSWNQGTGTPAVSTFELYVNGDDDPLSDQVGTDLVLTSYNNSMVGDCASDWVFTKGQTIAIRRTDSTALYGVTMSVVLEYDTTT